jgi:hypothetical protein
LKPEHRKIENLAMDKVLDAPPVRQ